MRQNIEALADDPIKLPCVLGGEACVFEIEVEVEEGEDEVGEMTLHGFRNKS